MRILLVHNRYQIPGGEDEVYERERRLLESNGHTVMTYEKSNTEIVGYNSLQKIALAPRTIWNPDSRRELARLIRRERPDVAHFHNTFPLVSPAAYYACRDAGVPVVQTLHSPRLLCPAGTFFRDGRLCEDCLGKALPWPGILHGCYRESRVQSAVVASMLSFHRWQGTWQHAVNAYIVATEFYRRKFIEGGLPPDKLMLKPHFVSPDPGPRAAPGDYALFVGRLSPEKGVPTLIEAWSRLNRIPLRIRGEGPLLGWVKEQAVRDGLPVSLPPRLEETAMFELLKGSRFLVWPSEGYYETFGLVAIEAFACGVPVIASRIGAMVEVVENGRTGLHFAPGDSGDLAAKVEWAWTHPEEMETMGRAARAEYETNYTPQRNYGRLVEIYAKVGDRRRRALLEHIPEPRPSAASAPHVERMPGAGAAGAHRASPPRHGPLPSDTLVRGRPRLEGIGKVLVVHNFYQQSGGEDVEFAAETALLRSYGHEVLEYLEDNDRIEQMNRLILAANTIWSRNARRRVVSLLRRERPDVVHFHNTFPLISPAAYYACKEAGVPVVQTLQNYRLICPGATLFRDGRLCEDCVGKQVPWAGAAHACYRGSHAASATVAAMLSVHNRLHTWAEAVDLFVPPTEFVRRKFIEGGLPAEKIVVKPNFADVDFVPRDRPGAYAFYLGRLSPEKGVGLLVDAWRQIGDRVPLQIAGDGPLRSQLEKRLAGAGPAAISLVGHLTRDAALDALRDARFLVVPSEWYEPFGLVVVEAFGAGTPVIAAKLGALEEIVRDGGTGLLFTPGDPLDLARKVEWAWNHPRDMQAMGRAARAEYEAKYTPERNYAMLTQIYSMVTRQHRTESPSPEAPPTARLPKGKSTRFSF